MRKIPVLFLLLMFFTASGWAQTPNQMPAKEYAIVIKGGTVIDPKNNINTLMDVAIQGGKIVLIAKNIDAKKGRQVVDAKGMYVTPGLIDLHTHVFWGTEPDHYLSNGLVAVTPDGITFRSGVTTVVDAGGAGWKSFDTFKKNVIDKSRTRVLSFLNIVGEGMRGGLWEQDMNDMDAAETAKKAVENKQYVVGFKLAHFGKADWTPVERVVEAGKQANMPVMIDFGEGKLPIQELFSKYLRPGDIYTHVYTELPNRDPIVDLTTRKLKPFMFDARKKGILFDVGFGGGSFDFRQALPATRAGFYPDALGTDLHTGSMNGAMKDQANVMSIFLAMGMKIPDIIKAATWAPAKAIHREELGNLSQGSGADVAIFSIRKGTFGFKDIAGNRQAGTQRFECQMTIRNGAIVYDLNAIADNAPVTNPNAR